LNSDERLCFIFDLDGTLLDDLNAIINVFTHKIPEKFGIPYSEEKERAMIGPALDMIQGKATKLMIVRLLWWYGKEIGLTVRQRFQMFRFVKEELVRLSPLFPFFPGTLEMVNELKSKGHIVGISTSSSKNEMDMKFGQRPDQLAIFEPYVMTRSTVKNLKPSPEGIFNIARMANIDIKRCIMVGDMPVDIEAGKNAGVSTIAVLCGFLTKERIDQMGLKPDFIVQDVADIRSHLNEIIEFCKNGNA
jgi:HAD superfamily hydrolase (TIGR01549 family)